MNKINANLTSCLNSNREDDSDFNDIMDGIEGNNGIGNDNDSVSPDEIIDDIVCQMIINDTINKMKQHEEDLKEILNES